MTGYPTLSHHPETELTSLYVSLLTPSARLRSDKYQTHESVMWLNREPNSRSPTLANFDLPLPGSPCSGFWLFISVDLQMPIEYSRPTLGSLHSDVGRAGACWWQRTGNRGKLGHFTMRQQHWWRNAQDFCNSNNIALPTTAMTPCAQVNQSKNNGGSITN